MSLSFDSDRDLPLVVGIEKGTPAAEAGLQVTIRRGRLSTWMPLCLVAASVSWREVDSRWATPRPPCTARVAYLR